MKHLGLVLINQIDNDLRKSSCVILTCYQISKTQKNLNGVVKLKILKIDLIVKSGFYSSIFVLICK